MQTQSIQLSYSSLNKRKSHKGLFVGITIIIVLVLILVAMIALLVVDNKRKDNHKYGVVFEAKRSMTIAHVYRWNKKHKNINGLDFHEVEYLSDPTKQVNRSVNKPISMLIGNESSVENYFKPLIEAAENFVPYGSRGSTLIYVRLLSESGVVNGTHDKLIDNIEDAISNSGFKTDKRCVKCVSKEEQHACVWLAMNYLRGVVYKDEEKENSCGKYGAFSLTNYSNTVIFNPKKGEAIKKYNHSITLGKEKYNIYDYSSTKYGKVDAFKRVINLAINDSQNRDENGTVLFPCYMRDYNTTLHNGEVFIKGTGDTEKCIEYISKDLNTSATCELEGPCFIDGVYMPSISEGYERFYALDDFYTTANFLSVTTGVPTKLESLYKNTAVYCNISFTHYTKELGLTGEQMARYCFWGAYTYSVLNAYGTKDGSIIFASNVEGVSFNYPYGAMLTEINI